MADTPADTQPVPPEAQDPAFTHVLAPPWAGEIPSPCGLRGLTCPGLDWPDPSDADPTSPWDPHRGVAP